MSIGKKIKEARLEMRLTQEELGNIVGVQKSAIAKYESGRVVNIKRSTMQKIASALEMRPSELVFEESPKASVDLHVKIITDFDLMETIKVYYDLDENKQKTIRDLIHGLKK